MAKPTLYLMLGYPGAGKTTAAEIISQLTGAVHLASDRVRLELFPQPQFTEAEHDALYHELDKRTGHFLLARKSVVYDANLNRYKHRQEKYKICQRTKARSILVWATIGKALAKQRAIAASRNHLVPSEEEPAAMFERIVNIFEPPRQDEPVVKLDGTKVTQDYVKQRLGL